MVAFTLSVIVMLAFTWGIVAYAKRRPADQPHTWGEAMFGSMLVFFLMFWAYGVVPHQWLTWAENELAWRTDKFFHGPGGFLKPQTEGGWNPITLNYQVIEHIIVVVIYVVVLAGNIWLWAVWQNRGKEAEAKAPARSAFGRPLVKEGSAS
ncbi:MAG: hypothetical protein GWN79_12180 [Actinobacteria bacterium]|nr:hypothetical protein [Actinomycetota bacterium]NIS32175.1 hypothetical protein [Actinomycetota bacterium]NIT96120.1 hypothetical protein [Actinomycetota bacterium]NIU19799.1 hypothetical protein [Actinomycetota bacterium]NIU67236.1 hypothetical protein [Actinomycetota bacterium]